MADGKDLLSGVLPDDRVPMVRPDGSLTSVRKVKYEHALESGYRFQSPEEQEKFASTLKYGDSPLKAGVAGVARGVTLGLSDVVAPDLGISSRETLKGLQEENPVASTIGDVAGSLVNPVNRLGGGVSRAVGATTKLGRIGAEALGGATVGSLFGAGNAVSDAALDNHPLTAESLVAHMGLGSVLGLGGGGIGGAIEEGASAMLPKLRTSMGGAQSLLDSIADDAAVKSTRATQAEMNRVGEAKLAQVANVLRERGHLKMTPEAMLESLQADIKNTGALKGGFLDAAEAKGATPVYSELLQRLDDFEAGLNPAERRIIAGDLKAARSDVAELGSRPAGAAGSKGSGFRALDDLKQTWQANAKFSKGPVPLDDVTIGLKRQLAGIFRDELDKQLLPQLGSDVAKDFIATKETYGALKDAERLATKGAGRAGGFGLKDQLWGVVGGSLHPVGIGSAIASKFMREHGQAIIAKTADALSKSPTLAAIADSFGKILPNVAPKMGPYGPALMEALQSGPRAALALHLVSGQTDPSYVATASAAGLQPEEPDQHVAALARAHGVASVAAVVAEQEKAVDEGLNHIIKGTKPPASAAPLKTQDFDAKQMRRGTPESHRRRVDEVRNLATQPEALLDRISKNAGNTGDYAPAVVASLTATAQRAVAYLAKEAETPPKPGPLARDWVTNDAERHAWTRKLEVVQEPMSIFRLASEGRLTRTQLDAVQAVYPALASDIRDRALNALVSGEKMPYRARMMLGLLSGIDPDGSMSRAAIAANQTAIANAGQKPSEQMPAPDKTKLGQASRMALPSQKRQLSIQGET